jgi:hypothetical protein
MICCGMAVKGMGMFRTTVRKMKALIAKMERVTLIGRGRQNLTRLVYYVYEIKSKIFSVSICFISGG